MADYVVKFTGLDNLTPTLNKIKGELSNTGNSANQLDKISQKLERITSSAAAPKKLLKDLLDLMARMNLNGLSNTDVFAKAASEAAKLKDSIADASQATRLLSSDTANLDAGILAVQGIAAAFSVATGAMGLFGVENEKVQLAILKVQSALAILNGVLQIANVLNKDSILVLKLQQLWLKLSATATDLKTAATTKNTVAQGLNTKAVNGSTLATKAWNVVTAISKALLGDWSGLLLVGVGALATWAITAERGADALERMNNSVKVFNTLAELMKKTSETAGQLLGKYLLLKTEYNQLKNEMQKAQFIKDHANDFKDLAISINSVADADKAFNQNTKQVIDNILKRAKAMAAYNLIVLHALKYMDTVLNTREYKYRVYRQGQSIPNSNIDLLKRAGAIYGKDYSINGNQFVLKLSGAAKLTQQELQKGYTQVLEQRITADRELNSSVEYLTRVIQQNTVNTPTSSTTTTHNGSGRTTRVPSKSDAEEEKRTALLKIIDEINQLVADRDYKIQLGIDTKDLDKKIKELLDKGILITDNIVANNPTQHDNDIIEDFYKNLIKFTNDNEQQERLERILNRFLIARLGEADKLKELNKQTEIASDNFRGAGYDVGIFLERLQGLYKRWDELGIEIAKLDKQISEASLDIYLYGEAANITKLALETLKNQRTDLQNERDLVAQGMNVLEQNIISSRKYAFTDDTFYPFLRYMMSDREKQKIIDENRLSTYSSISAALNRTAASLDSALSNARIAIAEAKEGEAPAIKPIEAPLNFTILGVDVPTFIEEVKGFYKALLEGTYYEPKEFKFISLLNESEVKQIIDIINKREKNTTTALDETKPLSVSLNISRDIMTNSDGTLSAELFTDFRNEFLTEETRQKAKSILNEINADIKELENNYQLAQASAIYDSISGITAVGNTFLSLSRTLSNVDASVWDKISATIDSILSVYSTIERITDLFKLFSEITNTLTSARTAADSLTSAISSKSEAAASEKLASSKTVEAAAHTANATAMGVETGAMVALTTSQAAATSSAIALYTATKKAAAASIFAAHANIPFVGVGIATGLVAEMEGVLAAVGAFANGGIVGGTSYSGDKILTRLNSGEMVLNRTQQGNLFNLLNNGIGGTGQVEFKIKGQELVGVLNNYNNKFNKVK